MNLDYFESMEKEDLQKYVEFMLKHYRFVDSMWFLAVEKDFGLQSAEELNGRVWTQIGSTATKDLKKYFNITEKGLDGLERALRLFPWTTLGGHKIEKGEKELVLTVAACPAQVARINQGMGEYVCKDMHRGQFENTVKRIDPRIRVVCDFAPPDPHPDELFCRWRFVL